MSSFFGWIKTHKLIILLMLVIAYLLLNSSPMTNNQTSVAKFSTGGTVTDKMLGFSPAQSLPAPGGAALQTAPQTNNRMVVKESSLSLLVSKVVETQKKIIDAVVKNGGFMVSSDLSNPQDIPTATVVVRFPTQKLDQMLEYFKSISVKVISENLQGEDVTDQYTDLQAQLDTLNKTKDKFGQIMDKATQIQDILEVQRELINIQSQIDSVKGQEQYLQKTTQMAKVTIYLSADELNLPYAPSEAWRPQVIFKQAIRSLLGSMRSLGSLAIWIAVYAVIWLPILLIVLFIRRKRSGKS
jgi:hypothetical protein